MRDPNTMMVLHEWFHVIYCQSKIVACWQEQYQQIIRCQRDRNEQKKDGYERRGEEEERRKNDNCMPFTILSLLVCRQWYSTMMVYYDVIFLPDRGRHGQSRPTLPDPDRPDQDSWLDSHQIFRFPHFLRSRRWTVVVEMNWSESVWERQKSGTKGGFCRRVDIGVFYTTRDHQVAKCISAVLYLWMMTFMYGLVEDPVGGWTCISICIELTQVKYRGSKVICWMRQQ